MAKRRRIGPREVLNPDRILNNLLSDYIEGNLDDYAVLFRAVVVAVDHIGGALSPDDEPPNPKNSIKARVISYSRDKDDDLEELPVFWPMFSHDVMPLKENEHVYVLFENNNSRSHGLWLTRIPEPFTADNKNLAPGNKKYEDNPNNDISDVGADRIVQDLEKKPEKIETSKEFVVEEIQPFRARIGDRVIEGSNNTLIVLGRDRPMDVGSGQKNQAGTIDIVAGRKTKEDMNLADDSSRIYISALTDIDTNLNIKNRPGPAVNGTAAIAIKSDEVRVIARKGMKVVVEGGDLHIEGKNIFIGLDSTESAVLGDRFKKYFEQVLQWLELHIHPTPTGPSGAPSSKPPGFDSGTLSKTVKIKK